MKRIVTFVFATFLMVSASNASAETQQVRLVIKGLVCSLCAQGLEKKFKALSEVQSVSVQFGVENAATKKKENVVDLTIVEGKTLTREQVETVVKDAGYNISVIEGI